MNTDLEELENRGLFSVQPDEWDRESWLDWRRGGIGGSDIAAIAGLSNFASPVSVFYDKIGEAAPTEETERMRWGRLLEAPIADEFVVRTGLAYGWAQLLVHDQKAPWRRATLDGLAFDGPRAELIVNGAFVDAEPIATVQIKTTAFGRWDEIPDYIACQCQWEMGLSRIPNCFLVALHGGNELVTYEIEFDARIFNALCAMADRFWLEYVTPRRVPPIDGSAPTSNAIRDAFKHPEQSSIELTGEALEAFERLPLQKQRVKEAETLLAQYENVIKQAIGNHTEATIDGETVLTWKQQTRKGTFDLAAFAAEQPELAAKFVGTPTTFRVLRQKETKKR